MQFVCKFRKDIFLSLPSLSRSHVTLLHWLFCCNISCCMPVCVPVSVRLCRLLFSVQKTFFSFSSCFAVSSFSATAAPFFIFLVYMYIQMKRKLFAIKRQWTNKLYPLGYSCLYALRVQYACINTNAVFVEYNNSK